MLKLKRISPKEIKKFLAKLPWILGENAFWVFLALVGFSLLAGGIIFYRYQSLIERAEPEAIEKQLQFKFETYQKILGIWQENEDRLKATDSKGYPNLFGL